MWNIKNKSLTKVFFLLFFGTLEAIVKGTPGKAHITYIPTIVIKNGLVTLTCHLESDKSLHDVTYQWYKGNHLLKTNQSSYTINSVELDARDNYTCRGVNDGGKGETDTAFLDVKAPPAFLLKPLAYVGVMYTSTNLRLICGVECYPRCSISWFKDGKLLENDSPLYEIETKYIDVDVQYKKFEATFSKLNWHMTGVADKKSHYNAVGNYTCTSSSNEVGIGVRSTTQVFVRGEQAD